MEKVLEFLSACGVRPERASEVKTVTTAGGARKLEAIYRIPIAWGSHAFIMEVLIMRDTGGEFGTSQAPQLGGELLHEILAVV